VRRRAPAWWGKYTMILSAALDSGIAFGVLVVFFVVIYPGWMNGFTWWGTEIYKQVRLNLKLPLNQSIPTHPPIFPLLAKHNLKRPEF
jgi:hypothetical protein